MGIKRKIKRKSKNKRKLLFGQFDDDESVNDLELRLGRIKHGYNDEFQLEDRLNDIMENRVSKVVDENSWKGVYSGINQMGRQIEFLNQHYNMLLNKINRLNNCLNEFDVETDVNEVMDLPDLSRETSDMKKFDLNNSLISAECYDTLNQSQNLIKSIQQTSAIIEVLCTRYIQKYNKIHKIFKPYGDEVNPKTIMTSFTR